MRPPEGGCVLTIGNFDGVHRGHQRLVERARALAEPRGQTPCALTFDPPPSAVLNPDRPAMRLMLLEDRIAHLTRAGADMVVVARTDLALLSLSADAFMRNIVKERFAPSFIIEGPSFRFGRGREGDTATLTALSAVLGIGVEIASPVEIELPDRGRRVVSSSMIRERLVNGDVDSAAAALGRPHALSGTVVKGRRRGRELGFPTINVDAPGQLWPADGVYAGQAQWDGEMRLAAVSIGAARTFDDGERRLEAHLLDFSGDLYGRRVRILFMGRIRDQRRFDSAQALREQLAADVRWVRRREGDAQGGNQA